MCNNFLKSERTIFKVSLLVLLTANMMLVVSAQSPGCTTMSFADAVTYGVSTSSGLQALETADFNGDGKLDLVTANSLTDNVSVLLGNGTGGFGAATHFAAGDFPKSVIVGDFNADNKPDLAVANLAAHTVSILIGNGSGGFSAPTDFTTGQFSTPFNITAADINGDGKLDVATANQISDNVSVLIGNGAGGFAPPVQYGSLNGAQFVSTGDFNEDGKLDMAVASFIPDTVSVLLANNSGGFLPQTNYTVGSDPRSVRVADLNADGNLDLVAASNGSSNFSVLIGDGLGGFAPAANYSPGAGVAQTAIRDFNLDGKLDIATANAGEDNVSIFLGSGDGTFTAGGNFGVNDTPTFPAAGDFNADGTPDLAVSNFTSNNISVLLSDCGVNTAPLASGDPYATDEDTPLNVTAPGVLVNDTDDQDTTLTAILVTGPSQAVAFTLNSDGSFSYTPNSNFNGSDSFTYKANDGDLDSNTVSVSITINPVNDAPAINSVVPSSATEDLLYTYNATSTDGDGPGATWSLGVGNTCGGSIVAGTGVYTFTPAGPVPAASCVVAVKVCDLGAPELCATQSTTIQIAAVNDAPVINSTAPANATEDVLYTYNATHVDPDGPMTIWSVAAGNTCGGTISATGVYTFTPLGPVSPSSCVVAIRVCDTTASSLCANQSSAVIIAGVNDAPVFTTTPPPTATEDTTYTYSASHSDPDGPFNTYTLVAGTHTCGGGFGTGGSSVFTFTPLGPVPPASCVISIRVCDGGSPNLCATQTTTIQIAAANDAPTITSVSGISRTQGAGASNSQVATVADPDNAPGSLAVTVNNGSSSTVNGVTVSGISINAAGQVTASISAACGATNASFTLRVTDPGPGSLFATVTLTVTVINETIPPVINPIANVVVFLPPNSSANSMPVSFPLPTATDNCSAAMVTTNPVSGSVFNAGTTTVTVTARDANDNTSTATFTVSVRYNFTAFWGRIPPDANPAVAGNSIPIGFSLDGNKGLDIFAPGSPSSQQANCSTWAPIGASTPTSASTALWFSAGQYLYSWTTSPSWTGTCRVFSMNLRDGTTRTLRYTFYN